MRERLVKHQIIEYRPNEPFLPSTPTAAAQKRFMSKTAIGMRSWSWPMPSEAVPGILLMARSS